MFSHKEIITNLELQPDLEFWQNHIYGYFTESIGISFIFV